MKKLLVLILLNGLRLTSFSQIDTGIDNDEKCFKISTVRLIMKDLLSGDSAKAVLKLTEEHLNECEIKSVFKDSIINKQLIKIDNLSGIISDERSKYGILEDHTKKLETSLKVQKLKNKWTFVSGGILVLVLGVLSIVN